jgi:undecaprenyl-diphosphatase
MTFWLIEHIVMMALIVAFLYFALHFYLGWKQPAWSAFAGKRRFAILLMLILATLAIKVSEDVVNRESGPIDVVVLQFIHTNVPPALNGLFKAATISGSAKVLLPLVVIMVLSLLYSKRRFEALLIASSAISGSIIVYVLKAVVARVRPALWDAEWYWGSSFPSGHTLIVAALATATVMSVNRIWPGAHTFAMLVAVIWVFSVCLSRLVLGVHWPTDVLVALCMGMFLPLAIGIALESRHL